jgi:protein-L-isoaspartate(D-aspartate) O-methyltransferase
MKRVVRRCCLWSLLSLVAMAAFAEVHGVLAADHTTSPGLAAANTRHPATKPAMGVPENSRFVEARQRMVENDLRKHGIRDDRVLGAMGRVERELFVPADREGEAYSDAALQIGNDQTISRPFIVAFMTELVRPSREKRALDIGTGSGYQAAVLAEVCKQVYSIEIVEPLANAAKKRLTSLGYRNINFRCGDGYRGWPEKAPFDIIVVAAAPDHVPQALIDQLAPGGRLVIPIGEDSQKLLLVEKNKDGSVQRHEVLAVKFVPMTGEARNNQKKHS